ncbi:hypothetical protein PTKIN_Ptkin11bG0199500 [Pterospermum kingtungense]
MSTIEKALLRIFETKIRIIENVKHKILSFDQHLASKCLIGGFVPPPWLLSSSSSDLNNEDLISGLLLPHPQPSISYCSLYQQPVVTTDNVKLAHVSCTRVGASNEGLDQCLSGKDDELDRSVTSPPQDCRGGMISDTRPDPGLSLGRLQRSRSRQRALEHRNSAKSCKNSECFEKNGDACSSQNKGSKIASLLSDPVDNLELIGFGDNVVSCVVEKEDSGQCWSHERSENVNSGIVTIQEPDVVHELPESKFIEPVHNTVSHSVTIEERGQCQSKEKDKDIYSGRITRSRSSVHPSKSVNNPSSAGKRFSVPKQDDIVLTESNDKSKLQPDAADELLQFVKPVDDVVTGIVAKKERSQCQSKERSENIYSSGIRRSRCSVQSPKSVSGLSRGVKTSDVAKCDGNIPIESISKSKLQGNVVDELLQLVKPAVISDESCNSRKAMEHGSKEKENSVYQGRLTRSRSSSNPPLSKSLNSQERIQLQVVGTSPQSASAMTVMPKQLNFDDVGEHNFNEASSLISGSEEVKSLEKNPLTPLPTANKQDEATSVHYQEKYNSSGEKPLPKEGEAFRKEEKLLETDLNMISGQGTTSNLNVMSSLKETSEASTYAVTNMVPKSNGISEQKIFDEDLSAAFKVASENLLRNSLKDAAGSNLNADTNYIFEKECGKLEAVKSVTLLAEASNPNSGVCSGHAVSADIDFTEVCSPALLRKAVATSSDAIEHPSSALFEETKRCSLKQKVELSPTENQNAGSIGRCMADGIDSVFVKSRENKVVITSMMPGRDSGSHVEGSLPHKRRKIVGQQSNSLCSSSSLKVEDIMQLNADMSLVDEEDQNAGKCNSKERSRNRNSSSTFMHEQFDVASISSFPLETLVNFEDHPVGGAVVVDQSSFTFGSTKQDTADKNQILLNIRDESGFGNIGHLACDKRSKQESKCPLEEDREFSTFLSSSPCQPPTDLITADQSRPELEGFIIQTDSEQICISEDGIKLDELDLPKTIVERASLLEQLCKSACMNTPLSQYPTTYKFHRATDFYQSVPNGLLECLDLRSTLLENDDKKTQLKVSISCFDEDRNHAFPGGYFSDCLPCSSSQVTGDLKKPYLSPVGKLWDRITSNSDSSEKRGSLNPELPCISEENENAEEVVDAFQEGTASEVVTSSVKREPLAEIKECPNVPASVSRAERFTIRDSLDSVNTAYSFTGTEKRIQEKVGKHNARKRRDTNKLKENQCPGAKRESESLRNRFSKPKPSEKTSLKGGPSFSQRESKVKNIVSNVTSFIPLVQQKQAASVITGRRDVKVKALEAAEAAKKLAEKKENDRKMKKEALKLERARLEKENLRQLELEKKRKEEERKIKEAEMAARKRQREEEERLEKERKRKRIEEARRQQRAPVEKLYSKKDEKEKKFQAPDERAQKMKVPNDEVKHEKMQKEIEGGNEGKRSEMEFRKAVASTSGAAEASSAIEDYHVKVISTADRAKESDNLIVDTSREQSYDISPYKESDDEDEEDDDGHHHHEPSKFIPSWASKNRVAQAVASQQKVDPEVIFPPESFCSIAQVILPRRLQQNHAS